MLDFYGEVYEAARDLLAKITFDRNNNVHRVVMSLYATILEQSDEALALLSLGKYSTLDVILRASLEAYVDLTNLCANDAYLGNMQASYHEQWIKLARAGVAGNNPYLAPFASQEAVQKLATHEADLAALTAAGTPVLSVFDKFDRAGMEHEYRSIYNSLCNESHNNIRALTRRHFRSGPNGENRLVIFDEYSEADLAPSLISYIGIVVSSTQRVHDYFGTNATEDVEALVQAHAAFKAEVEAEA